MKGVEMPKPEDLARLNRHVRLSTLASCGVLLFGLIFLTLYIHPALMGISPELHGDYKGGPVWLATGAALALAGSVFLYTSTHWAFQIKKIAWNTPPVKMKLKLEVEEDSDSTAYFAVITKEGTNTEGSPGWRVQIWVHPPCVRDDMGRQFECNVYFHPELKRPVAVEYTRGFLWMMAGAGAATRLPNDGPKGFSPGDDKGS